MIEDFVSRRQFSAEDIDAPGAESPARSAMQPGEHLSEQFAGLTRSPETPATRSPHHINGRTVHQWRSGDASSEGATP
jgi:hypothetical protein